MTVPLTKEQATNLMAFIDYMFLHCPAESREEKILDLLINKIRVKLWNKLNVRTQKRYGVTLTQEEALAFEEWFSQVWSSVKPLEFVMEKNLAKTISNQANAVYG